MPRKLQVLARLLCPVVAFARASSPAFPLACFAFDRGSEMQMSPLALTQYDIAVLLLSSSHRFLLHRFLRFVRDAIFAFVSLLLVSIAASVAGLRFAHACIFFASAGLVGHARGAGLRRRLALLHDQVRVASVSSFLRECFVPLFRFV